MAVLVEARSVIVRRDAIDERLEGGGEGFGKKNCGGERIWGGGGWEACHTAKRKPRPHGALMAFLMAALIAAPLARGRRQPHNHTRMRIVCESGFIT